MTRPVRPSTMMSAIRPPGYSQRTTIDSAAVAGAQKTARTAGRGALHGLAHADARAFVALLTAADGRDDPRAGRVLRNRLRQGRGGEQGGKSMAGSGSWIDWFRSPASERGLNGQHRPI